MTGDTEVMPKVWIISFKLSDVLYEPMKERMKETGFLNNSDYIRYLIRKDMNLEP